MGIFEGMSASVNIILLGKPGSGKTTLSEMLGEHYNMRVIGSGEYLRGLTEGDSLIAEYVSSFWTIETLFDIGMEYISKELELCVSGNQNFVIGPPKTVKEAEKRDSLHIQKGIFIDAVVELDISDDQCLERISNRTVETSTGTSTKRRDDTIKSAEGRIDNHNNCIEAILDYYAKQPHITMLKLDAAQDIETTFSGLAKFVEELSAANRPEVCIPEVAVELAKQTPHTDYFERIFGSARAKLFITSINNFPQKNQAQNRKRQGFNITRPVLLCQSNIKMLSENPYRITYQVKGKRVWLYVKEHELFLIDRKHAVWKLKNLHSPQPVWNGYIFDCIWDVENNRILVNDCIVDPHLSRHEQFDLRARVTTLSKFLEQLEKQNGPRMLILGQEFYHISKVIDLKNAIQNDPEFKYEGFQVKGLLFVPVTGNYCLGTCSYMFHWKTAKQNKLTLRCNKELDCDGQQVQFSVGGFSANKVKTLGPLESTSEPLPDTSIIDCDYQNGKFHLIRIRNDGKAPQGDFIVRKKISAFDSPVTLDDVVTACKGLQPLKPKYVPPHVRRGAPDKKRSYPSNHRGGKRTRN